jgi:MarR family transcriptional regulator, organic hydroperoxide resistance regulator
VVLLALWEESRKQNHVTVSALGEKVSLDSGTLTPLLKRLQARSLIVRERGAADEREVHIKLTREGLALKKNAEAIHEQIACASACSTSDRKALTRALQKLRASLLANQLA